ncbi:MAG: GAF domain-containing protein [Anaerolineae bacterium]|nr:MAG: GAF domain-containing protein [Anaerolineae bacterium]MCL4879405.1 GAF domain-containing protein [Anaerolineae bacterium]
MAKSREENLADVDRTLDEVREMLTLTRDTGEINELQALQMLLKVTKELHNIHETHDLIAKVLDSVIAFADGDRAFLMLLDENNIPQFKMGRDASGEYLARDAFSPSQGVLEKTLAEEHTVIVPDAQNDPDLSKRESVQEMSLRTIMCSPLMIKRTIIGLLYVDSSKNPLTHYTRAHINVLASLADQSAVAIRNAQKFETRT